MADSYWLDGGFSYHRCAIFGYFVRTHCIMVSNVATFQVPAFSPFSLAKTALQLTFILPIILYGCTGHATACAACRQVSSYKRGTVAKRHCCWCLWLIILGIVNFLNLLWLSEFSFCNQVMISLVVCSVSLFLVRLFVTARISGKCSELCYCRYYCSWLGVASPCPCW